MTQMCGDQKMLQAYKEGKDLYAEIAALAFHTTYLECLEHFPKDTPIKEVNGEFRYATKDEIDNNQYDKLADGETDTYYPGKERRSKAKSILLGVLYGRQEASIAEQLGCTVDEAKAIKNSVFKGFPAIQKFEMDSINMAKSKGYVTTLWGRKRRLPDMRLPEYEFKWKPGYTPDVDLLDFSDNTTTIPEVPKLTKQKYIHRLNKAYFRDRRNIISEALEKDNIVITQNGAKINDATRQCVNSRIQGSAADMSKKAMIAVANNEELKQLGFRLLIPVHDELIGECPIENAKRCKELFAELMSTCATDKLHIPIKCDVTVSDRWYGDEIEL